MALYRWKASLSVRPHAVCTPSTLFAVTGPSVKLNVGPPALRARTLAKMSSRSQKSRIARSSESASGLSDRTGNMGRSLSPRSAGARTHHRRPRRRAGPRRLPAGDQAAQVGSLPGVLRVVVDDADQPDAECHGRVPAFVHDPVQVGI